VGKRLIFIAAISALFSGLPSSIRAQAGDPTTAKVEKIVAGMTLEQKLSLIAGEGMTLVAIPSTGLPMIKMSDGRMNALFMKFTFRPSRPQ
jgi:hypothetical protein